MLEFKQSVARWAPVRIYNTAGSPVSGLAYTAVTGAVQKSDGSVSTFTIATTDWIEATTGAFASAGVYMVQIPAAALSLTGALNYAIASSGNNTYIGAVKVVANEEADTYTRLGAPAGASVSADIASITSTLGTVNSKIGTPASTVSADIAAIQTKLGTPTGGSVSSDIATVLSDLGVITTRVYRIQQLKEGHWKIFTSGGDANRLVLYAADGTTVLQKWDLKNAAGAASSAEVFERIPVLAVP
jgi:hypothetical protein